MPTLPLLAAIAIPDARHCLMLAGPVAGFLALRWLVHNTDAIIDRLFPHWAWEKKLGWLNLRAHQQAETVLRGLRHIVHATLAVALYGIVWSAAGISAFWESTEEVANGIWKLSVLLVCLGVWAVYLGCDLIPKLRRTYEEEELQKFRAEQSRYETEEEKMASRLGKSKDVWVQPLPTKRSDSRRN